MTDVFSPDARSRVMSQIRGKDTGPEMIVRRLAHAMGYRYRLHRSDLPGKPDLVFPRYRSVVFVNGCFWHGHTCGRGKRPASNTEFWDGKLEATKKRDARVVQELESRGWRVLTLWQCELGDAADIADRIRSFLETSSSDGSST